MIDVHSDKYSFGFRKGRSAHQAIGELSRILQHKPENRRMKRVIEKRSYFAHNKFDAASDAVCAQIKFLAPTIVGVGGGSRNDYGEYKVKLG